MANRQLADPSHADRVGPALEFIEAHLGDRISLQLVAEATGVSRWHIARAFRAQVGDSLMGYVRKRRLSIAAERLGSEERISLLELALDSQFGSQEAFTRAFKRLFEATPGRVRKVGSTDRMRCRTRWTAATLAALRSQLTMRPLIVAGDEFWVSGLRASFNDATKRKYRRSGRGSAPLPIECRGAGDRTRFGISESCADRAGHFTYLAGVEVSPGDRAPEEFEVRHMAPQTYAVFKHTIDSRDLHQDLKPTLEYIWAVWLPNGAYRAAPAPDFERYQPRAPTGPAARTVEIWVPGLPKPSFGR